MSERQEIRAATAIDDIDRLRDTCLAVITPLPRSHARAFALSKLGELIYWLRACEARRQREGDHGAA